MTRETSTAHHASVPVGGESASSFAILRAMLFVDDMESYDLKS
jgi:hypothetical protein